MGNTEEKKLDTSMIKLSRFIVRNYSRNLPHLEIQVDKGRESYLIEKIKVRNQWIMHGKVETMIVKAHRSTSLLNYSCNLLLQIGSNKNLFLTGSKLLHGMDGTDEDPTILLKC